MFLEYMAEVILAQDIQQQSLQEWVEIPLSVLPGRDHINSS